jgi:DNA-binding CsgD family transcriptional regulator
MTDENGLGAISEEVASLEVLIERATALQPLTAIEKHICSLMFTGHTAKEIAVLRSCSYRTVERHIANLKLKIGELKLSPAALLAIHNLDLKKSNESDAIAQQDL